MPVMSNEFWAELEKLVELPKNCASLNLHLENDCIVTADAVLYVGLKERVSLKAVDSVEVAKFEPTKVTKRYRLEEITND